LGGGGFEAGEEGRLSEGVGDGKFEEVGVGFECYACLGIR